MQHQIYNHETNASLTAQLVNVAEGLQFPTLDHAKPVNSILIYCQFQCIKLPIRAPTICK